MGLDLRLAVTDLPVGLLPVHVRCPDAIHKERIGKSDRQSSLAVYPDNIHCYGCGFDRSKEWALAALLGVPLAEARANLSKYTSEAVDAYRDRVEQMTKTEPLHPALAQMYHEVLMTGPRKHRLQWLFDRGLNDETIMRHQIGHDGQRFVIPIYDGEGSLRTFRYRRDDEYLDDKYPKYCGVAGRNGQFLYPIPSDIEALPALYLCEGEFDALLLNQLRHPAITITNGAGQVKKMPAIIKERWPWIHTLYIATDQDEAGEEAARLTLKAATELGFQAMRLRWTAGKDITDAVKLGFTEFTIG